MSNTNRLYSSSQVIQVASGENYTLKDDEVCINNFIYKKVDIEIISDPLLTNSVANTVKIGITKRDGSRNIPATPIPFNKWQIDGVYQTTLENCINNITAFIKPIKSTSTRSIVFVNDNPFLLVKHPTNNSPLNTGIIENNDIITNGYFDNTTFWGKAQCIDEAETDNSASWTVLDSIEELTLI